MIELPDNDFGFSDDDDDFGFSFVNEEELESYNKSKQLESEVKEKSRSAEVLEKKLLMMEKMILPLLENLKAEPQKEYILWPNREEKIDKFIEKINKVVHD